MKKNIIFGTILLIISIFLIIIKNIDNTIEGKVVDIYDNKYLLIHVDNEPISVTFNKNIKNINLNDIVKINTDGTARESFPVQMNGFSIKKIKNDYKKIDENIKSILFDTTYYKELPIYKSKFKTVIYKEKEEFKKYVNNSKITLGENIDEIYKNSFAIISTTSMSSEGTIFCNGIYQNNNDISINLKIETNETTNTNIITKGCIIILDKKYINYNFETVSETIIKK